ncbi:hypothetical protein ACFU99_30935 [Streptomyces sp. NPDC057654]|uniref:hypothetical protein n=1 Tax=Streptomyces sp. NPDC057654 TaxID=3346196 RepID=UPI0036A2779E
MHRSAAATLSLAALATGLLGTGAATAQSRHSAHLSSPADDAGCVGVTITAPAAGTVLRAGGKARIDIHRDAASPTEAVLSINLFQIRPGGEPPELVETAWNGEEQISDVFSFKDMLPSTVPAGEYVYSVDLRTHADEVCRSESGRFTIVR